MENVERVKSIKEFHSICDLAPPEHPLISLVDYSQLNPPGKNYPSTWMYDFYIISIKKNLNGYLKYGQQDYDFDNGLMFFLAPNQVLSIEIHPNTSPNRQGWMLLIHPDFLWNTNLATEINQYEFFDYAIHEALFLSKQEEKTIQGLIKNIQHEYHSKIDKFSQQIIIAHIETLLKYSERFYERQFITRQIGNHQVLVKLEKLLNDYFNSNLQIEQGLPTVELVAGELNLSPNYLSGLLRSLTGQSTKQHIQEKVIAIAKQKLSTTNYSISEIAYDLGFEYPQTFSSLFKSKTSLSPLAFRNSFN